MKNSKNGNCFVFPVSSNEHQINCTTATKPSKSQRQGYRSLLRREFNDSIHKSPRNQFNIYRQKKRVISQQISLCTYISIYYHSLNLSRINLHQRKQRCLSISRSLRIFCSSWSKESSTTVMFSLIYRSTMQSKQLPAKKQSMST